MTRFQTVIYSAIFYKYLIHSQSVSFGRTIMYIYSLFRLKRTNSTKNADKYKQIVNNYFQKQLDIIKISYYICMTTKLKNSKLKTYILIKMEKKGLKTIYDLDLSDITEIKPATEQRLPDFMLFMEKTRMVNPRKNYKTREHINQTWTIPGRTYKWFPCYTMYLTSK